MEKVIVNNKFMVSTESKWRMVSKYILIVCGTIILLSAIFRLLMGDDISIFSEVIFPLVILIQGFRISGRAKGYTLIPLEIFLEKDEVRFVYPNIDRQDKRGAHKETYIYRKDDVIELKSNLKEKAICVAGMAEFTGEYPDGQTEYINGREKELSYDFYITLSDEKEWTRVVEGLQKSLSRIAYQSS